MDDERELRALLTRTADTVGVLHPPSIELLEHHRHRQRLIISILAPICAALLVIALAVALEVRRSHEPPPAAPVGVQTLQSYRWTSAPPSPLIPRSGAAAAWTGSQLILWGGQYRSAHYDADGATYDPATHKWMMLPASPLSARGSMFSVWTGSALFIWGGIHRAGQLTDGALYDPVTTRWTRVATAPMRSGYLDGGAYLVGSKVLLLTVPHRPTDLPAGAYDTVAAALYDPSTNTWQREPTLRLPVRHAIEHLNGVAAGDNVLVQFSWQGGTASLGYTYHGATSTWARNQLALPYNSFAEHVLWTGTRVLQAPIDRLCRHCPPKSPAGLSTDPTTGATMTIKRNYVFDESSPLAIWTGAALLGVARTNEPGRPPAWYPGLTYAWDPVTNTWTPLRGAANLAGADSLDARSGLWTGSSLFIWTDGNYPGHLTVLQFAHS